MNQQRLLLSLVVCAVGLLASAQSSFLRRSTDVLCLAPSTTAFVKATLDHDRRGMLQLGLSSATTLAVNYALEATISKDRPDGTGHHAFPSTHTAVAFDGATFLLRRYGWQWGVPAYVVSTYVAWGRVHTDRHDWWDVLGGAAIGAGSALIFSRPVMKDVNLTIAPVAYGNDGAGVYATLKF